MNYFLAVYTPRTYEAFSKTPMQEIGVVDRYKNLCSTVNPGDKVICYMMQFNRWIGVLEVIEKFKVNNNHNIYYENDPYNLQCKVKCLVWLPKEKTIPLNNVYKKLDFLKERYEQKRWGSYFQRSIGTLNPDAGKFLEEVLLLQSQKNEIFTLDEIQYQRVLEWPLPSSIKVEGKNISVTIPEDNQNHEIPTGEDEITEDTTEKVKVREHPIIQSLVASVGEKLRLKVWIPTSDRNIVRNLSKLKDETILKELPFNYNSSTIKTIERIDVIWTKKRRIIDVFEIEDTSSIFSGILRMGDLVSLQPDINIRLHIVAPEHRRSAVRDQIRRPIFSLLDPPLARLCDFISYDRFREISELEHLRRMGPDILEDYVEYFDEEEVLCEEGEE